MLNRNFLYTEDYNISLTKAKKLPCYKCFKADYLPSLKTLLTSNKGCDIPSENVPIMIQFGCIDIELTLLEDDGDGQINAGYVVCIRHSTGWETYDYTQDTVVVVEDMEREMFRILMKFAKECNLPWSYPDDIEHITKNHVGTEKFPLYTVTYRDEDNWLCCEELAKYDPRLKTEKFVTVLEPNTNISLKEIDEDKYYHMSITSNGNSYLYKNIDADTLYKELGKAKFYEFINIFPAD